MTKEYVTKVIKAHEECDASHTKESKKQKQVVKADNPEDPVIRLLEATCQAVRVQANRAIDAFLNKIKETLRKHVPISAQAPLIANSLSTCMQFKMSIWQMIWNECIRPMRTQHSDWWRLAGIVQAIINTFPNNCTIMFPCALSPNVTFSGTFQPASSEDEDNDGDSVSHGTGFRQFDQGSPMPSGSGCGFHSDYSPFSSTPLPHGGCFFIAMDKAGMPSSSLGSPPVDDDELAPWPYDEELELGMEVDKEGDSKKQVLDDDGPGVDPKELEILQAIVNKGQGPKPTSTPKSGDKRGLSHLDGSISSDSSGEDLDAKGMKTTKKGLTPSKTAPNPSQWTEEDIDVLHQYRYKTDIDRFQTYRCNNMKLANLNTINVKDYSAYIEVAKADLGTVIEKSVFSMVSYWEVLWLKGGDIAKFDKKVGAKFKKSAKGSRAPDDKKVAIN